MPVITVSKSIGIYALVINNKKNNWVWLIKDHRLSIDAVLIMLIAATIKEVIATRDIVEILIVCAVSEAKLLAADEELGIVIAFIQAPELEVYPEIHTTQ